jgi:hypothetical protein
VLDAFLFRGGGRGGRAVLEQLGGAEAEPGGGDQGDRRGDEGTTGDHG